MVALSGLGRDSCRVCDEFDERGRAVAERHMIEAVRRAVIAAIRTAGSEAVINGSAEA